LRDLIRERVGREEEILTKRAALIKSEKSGPGTRSVEDFWAEAEMRHKSIMHRHQLPVVAEQDLLQISLTPSITGFTRLRSKSSALAPAVNDKCK